MGLNQMSIEGNCIPRSVLYNINPYSSQDNRKECLISYIIRLAAEHFVSVGDLMNQVVFKELKIKYIERISIKGGNRFYENAKFLNGESNLSNSIVKALNYLTDRDDLSDLRIKTIFSKRNIFNNSIKWCSQCLIEWKNKGMVLYYPLIWMTSFIDVCVDHKVFLKNTCNTCGKKQPILTRNTVIGKCYHCNKNFFENDVVSMLVDTEAINFSSFAEKSLDELIKEEFVCR